MSAPGHILTLLLVVKKRLGKSLGPRDFERLSMLYPEHEAYFTKLSRSFISVTSESKWESKMSNSEPKLGDILHELYTEKAKQGSIVTHDDVLELSRQYPDKQGELLIIAALLAMSEAEGPKDGSQ
jgi:hypothetical protein